MTRWPRATAGASLTAAIFVAVVAACGSDDGASTTAGDTTVDTGSEAGVSDTGPDTTELLDVSDFDGTGFAYLVVEPTAIDFGIRPVGETHTRDLELENAGNRELEITEIGYKNGGANGAFATNRSGGITLAPGARDVVKVTFFVLEATARDDVLQLVSNSATGATWDIAVSGGGIVFECVDLDGDLYGPYCDPGDDCNQADPNVYVGATERCNNIDDDCNGLIDEDWIGLQTSCQTGVGACVTTGTKVCGPDEASLVCAVNALSGGSELCNNIDDDCNNATDEDFPELGDLCTVGEGACRQSDKWVCSDDGQTTVCNVDPLPPVTEVDGDGIDNDCDGLTDELFDPVVGCSDGEREGFVDAAVYPDIAACSGGWDVGGVVVSQLSPTCGRDAGDDVANAAGVGCNVADLCAEGWHVCESAVDVAGSGAAGCADAAPEPGLFFVTRQSGTGCGQCATGTQTGGACNSPSSCKSGCTPSIFLSNDVFGCGSLGAPPAGSCAPLNAFSHNNCNALVPPWACSGSTVEASNVVKHGPAAGGALCCRESL